MKITRISFRTRRNALAIAASMSISALTSSISSQDLVLEPGEHGVHRLLCDLASRSGVDLVSLSPFEGAGTCTLQSRLELNAKECRRVLEAIRCNNGNPGEAPVSRTFELDESSGAAMVTMLRPFLAPHVAALTAQGRSVTVTSRRGVVNWVQRFIAMLDTAAADTAARSERELPERGAELVLSAGEYEVVDLVDRCAAHLGQNILVPPHENAAGRAISIEQPVTLDTASCDEFLRTRLRDLGLVIAELDGSLGLFQVLSLDGPRRSHLAQFARPVDEKTVLSTRTVPELVLCRVTVDGANAGRAAWALARVSEQGVAPLTFGSVADAVVLFGLKADVAAGLDVLRAQSGR